MKKYNVLVIGAGAAGLTAAAVAVSRGKSVAILEMGDKPARKVMTSGGGRCNFTNTTISCDKYFGKNPKFVSSAINKVTPGYILNWAKEHDIKWVEKNPGQYFCATGATDIVNALLKDAQKASLITNTKVISVVLESNNFRIITNKGDFIAEKLIIATGGISFPSLGVSDLGYKIAKQFGHKIVPVRPALCAIETKMFSPDLSGISIPASVTINKEEIIDSLLFTHFGLGGPLIYRATVRDFDEISLNLLPRINLYEMLRKAKKEQGRKTIANLLSDVLPVKLSKWLCSEIKHIADYKDSELLSFSDKIQNLTISKNKIKLHSLQSAEVVRGGIDTAEISSKTMESKLCHGLFFVGEVIDIAGDLGGFNLHWAWASGHVAGENV